MDKYYEKKYHDLESSHYWFRSRREHIVSLLKDEDRNKTILDVGCSSGRLILDLVDAGFAKKNIYGIDISAVAIESCTVNGIGNVFVMDAEEPHLPVKFDIIIASDCLEHLANDEKALFNWKELLNPGGLLYIFVPAYKFLWSHHDVVNMHHRRYSSKELITKVKSQGLTVIEYGYWNFILFIPVLIARTIDKLIPGKRINSSGDLDKLSAFNKLLYFLMSFENKNIKRSLKPFGVSAFCICQ